MGAGYGVEAGTVESRHLHLGNMEGLLKEMQSGSDLSSHG